MISKPDIRLDHVNLLATNSEWLADRYAANFGFQANNDFVCGLGRLLVFDKSEALDSKNNVHFGFRCGERDPVVSWVNKINASLEQSEDPEGNLFEVYREAEE